MDRRVLLYVEDEDAAVFLLETALKEAEIDVALYRVADGEEAIAFLRRSGEYREMPRPDLVLLDLNLPRKTGLEVLCEMQDSEDLRTVSVVVFTSSSLSIDRRKSMALGALQYITKPASFDSFVAAVKDACSHLQNGNAKVN
jgi:DNA-binding response OmpR family regulator